VIGDHPSHHFTGFQREYFQTADGLRDEGTVSMIMDGLARNAEKGSDELEWNRAII
jgi:hypothetical protein